MKLNLKKVMLSMLPLIILFSIILQSGASEAFLNISNIGVIDYTPSSNSDWIPSDTHVWFSSDFSTTQKIQQSDKTVLSDFPSMFCYPDTKVYNALSFNTNTFHSASRSFKITWGGDIVTEKPRPQVRIYNIPTEYWASIWFYLPSNFALKNWDLITAPFIAVYLPTEERTPDMIRRYAIIYLQGVGGDGTGEIRIRVQVRQAVGTEATDLFNSGDLEGLINRGEWINLRYHVKIAELGEIEVWVESASVTKRKIATYHGDIRNVNLPRNTHDLIPMQYYCRIDEPLSAIYFDDLKVWSR